MINRSNCNYYNNAIINHVMIKENMILPKTVLRGVETVLMQAIQLFSLQEETQRLMKHRFILFQLFKKVVFIQSFACIAC